MNRSLKNQGKLALRRFFELGQKFGFDLLPRHFYSEIPDIRQLKTDLGWRAPFDMQCIRGGLDSQVQFIRDCTNSYSAELSDQRIHQAALDMNGSDEGYGEVEAAMLYCFVRRHQPKTIIQVGCGVSTAVCLLAARAEGYKPRIICVEPFPTEFLQKAHSSGDIELLKQKAQDVDLEVYRQMGSGDLFFIDSSHSLGPGGEVSRIILGILPKIASGAFVHFHDIYFPYDYCPTVLAGDLFFFHESPLLYAFLCMNERYRIEASMAQLFHSRLSDLKHCFPQMTPAGFTDGLMTKPGQFPSSIFLRA